jgi:hypothetical protein
MNWMRGRGGTMVWMEPVAGGVAVLSRTVGRAAESRLDGRVKNFRLVAQSLLMPVVL